MALMQQRVVKIISKTPSERREADIQMVLPWLRKKSGLFTDLDRSEFLRERERERERERSSSSSGKV